GGDTGSDCVGTARRQGARQIHQFEILPQPPVSRVDNNPWPDWPNVMRTSTSQEEGCQRRWSVLTKKLTAQNGHLSKLHGCEVEWISDGQNWQMNEIPHSEFSMSVDLILLAMGFEHVVHPGLIEKFGIKLDNRGNVIIDENFMTSEQGVFASGDTVEGASLVVRAIQSGRKAAEGVDRWLRNS
ncbi:MAG: FAD-dependent oxidoreductase, partial [Sedimentisphaerales bacterium]|nr:FAD-dependent oxidoreductase [Sedimentisphaerales bacterium]